MVEVLAKAMVVSILQYISVSNKHLVHLKLTQCYMSIISHKAVKNKYIKCLFNQSYCIYIQFFKSYIYVS